VADPEFMNGGSQLYVSG